jgi:hypothetical protein
VKSKDILVELVTELKDRRGNNSISFGLAKSPETKQMKKNINSMIGSQATAAKHNATKEAMALLQYKIDAATSGLERSRSEHERNKYTLMIEKLQLKLDKYLDEDSEEDEALGTFADALDDATE